MASTLYKSITDIKRIVADDIREGVALEYKSSSILTSKGSASICKGVSAFANSAGGQFIIGISSKDGKATGIDGGFVGPSKIDWIYQIVNSNTHPAVENFNVTEIADGGGLYYIIDVPVSERAPHQFDNKYYKRRGPHSDPMEHYEIEDVRSRPKADLLPFRAEIIPDGFLALLGFSNADSVHPITDLRCNVTANFALERTGVRSLDARTFRRLQPNGMIAFHLDTFSSLLKLNNQAEVTVEASFTFKGALLKSRTNLSIADFDGTAIMKSPPIRAIEHISEQIGKLSDAFKPIKDIANMFEQAVDGSGLRLSMRTLSSLQGQTLKFDPREFDYKGYQIILNVSIDDALLLHRLFHTFGGSGSLKSEYSDLPAELKAKFEKSFNLDFLDGED